MRGHIQVLAAFAVALLLGLACSDDSGNGTDPDVITVSDLVGAWTSTAWTFENPATNEEIDMIDFGFAVTIFVEENRRYTLTILAGDEVMEADTGVLSVDGTVLIADPDDSDQNEYFSFSLQGGVFEVMNPSEEFDFDGDEVEEPAILRITFVRS